MKLKSINPSTGAVIQEYRTDTNKEVLAKLDKAENAFRAWKQTTFEQRANLLLNCARLLEEDKVKLAKIMHDEMGKVMPEAIAEIEKCAWVCNYYAENGAAFLKPENLPIEGKNVEVLYQPLGALLAIMPWNFPFWQVFRFAAPSIMAGNVGLLKHASNVSGCALAIEEIIIKSGVQAGVFQTLLITASEVKNVIASSVVKAVTLTGSERAGSAVAAIAGENLKKAVLELGGSDPFVVLEDADIALAVSAGVKSRMLNVGQSCIAAKRFIVVEKLHDEFVERFKKGIEVLIKDKDYGPMSRVDLAEELENQMKESIVKGAKLVSGGKRRAAYFEPTILTNIKKGMPAYNEELFGPIASVIKVKNKDQAVEVANDTNFGLGASVWSEDMNVAKLVANEIEAGAVFINQIVASDPRIPFGGIKNSGYGRELGLWGIREFVNVKPVVS